MTAPNNLEFPPGHRVGIIFQCALLLVPTVGFYVLCLIFEIYRSLGSGQLGTIYFLFALGPFLYLGAKILISAIDGPSKLSRNSMIAWCMCGIAAALTIYSLAKLILWESSNINTGSGVQYVVFALGSPLGFSFLHCLYLRLRCC